MYVNSLDDFALCMLFWIVSHYSTLVWSESCLPPDLFCRPHVWARESDAQWITWCKTVPAHINCDIIEITLLFTVNIIRLRHEDRHLQCAQEVRRQEARCAVKLLSWRLETAPQSRCTHKHCTTQCTRVKPPSSSLRSSPLLISLSAPPCLHLPYRERYWIREVLTQLYKTLWVNWWSVTNPVTIQSHKKKGVE